MEDISLHVLDIAENSIRANAKNVEIMILEDKKNDLLTLTIEDDGDGMDDKTKAFAVNPFFSTKKGKKVGLGLAFLSHSAEEAGGAMEVESEPGKGTKITATFKLGHIDRKPFGNLNETIKCLKMTHPEINITFDNVKQTG
ncbi:MAG: sensor histidine kinase [Desulfobulbaceae bacterium]|nr:sensor histidine kinase [Desulfobulbaceae bacterium]